MIRGTWMLLLAWGCTSPVVSSEDPMTAGTDPTSAQEPGAAAGTPTEGTLSSTVLDTSVDGVWVVLERELTLDECGMSDWLDQQELGTVEMVGDWVDGFELTHSRGVEWCTEGEATADAYRCDVRQDQDTRVQDDYGIDALLVLDVWVTGTLDEHGDLSMTTEILTDCEGSGCWLAALETGGFPCHSTVVVQAEPN